MKFFGEYHPAATAVYFTAEVLIVMFCGNPFLYMISLFGAVLFFTVQPRGRKGRLIGAFILLFFLTALINPIFYHNGVTVLLVINDNPITLESLIYGVSSACMITAVLFWSACFTNIMTSDKLLYLFGTISPKFALLISMTLRFIPLFSKQSEKTDNAQKALGLYKNDNIPDTLRGKLRVFGIMATWALENGIITADSMSARGYGTGKRTFYSYYRFRKPDLFLILSSVVFSAAVITGISLGLTAFVYYPAVKLPVNGVYAAVIYIIYGVHSVIPFVIEAVGEVKWKYLMSEI